MSTDPTPAPGSSPPPASNTSDLDKTREMLIGRLKVYIKPGEQRDRYSNIMKRWNSHTDKGSVTEDELRKLLNEVSPPKDDSPAAS